MSVKLLNRLPLHRLASRSERCQGRVPAKYLLRYGPLPFALCISLSDRTRTSGLWASFSAAAFARCASTAFHCAGVSLSVRPALSSCTIRARKAACCACFCASSTRPACFAWAYGVSRNSPNIERLSPHAVVFIRHPNRPACRVFFVIVCSAPVAAFVAMNSVRIPISRTNLLLKGQPTWTLHNPASTGRLHFPDGERDSFRNPRYDCTILIGVVHSFPFSQRFFGRGGQGLRASAIPVHACCHSAAV